METEESLYFYIDERTEEPAGPVIFDLLLNFYLKKDISDTTRVTESRENNWRSFSELINEDPNRLAQFNEVKDNLVNEQAAAKQAAEQKAAAKQVAKEQAAAKLAAKEQAAKEQAAVDKFNHEIKDARINYYIEARNFRKKISMLLVLATFLLIFFTLGLWFSLFKQNAKWEYRIVSPSDADFISILNDYGNDGWQLVSARRAINSNTASYECILKRKAK
ncbi:DUF4177 domain-containing protein [Verrucomicrobiales bacterium]|nr:DUF4177 domain-containing protein [Verrucomicrobiales bacterium]